MIGLHVVRLRLKLSGVNESVPWHFTPIHRACPQTHLFKSGKDCRASNERIALARYIDFRERLNTAFTNFGRPDEDRRTLTVRVAEVKHVIDVGEVKIGES